jgi:UDP-glucose 4-epimerase
MSYAGKTVLITGAGGFIAANLAVMLAGEEVHIRRLYRGARAPAPVGGRARVEDVAGQLQDPTLWNAVLGDVSVVFHLAAQTSLYVAAENPAADFEVNVLPLLRLLEACKLRGGRPHVVLASTVTVAGLTEALPVDEGHADRPLTVYDLHKQMAENYLRHYVQEGAVTGTILRLANVYGPGPASKRAERGFLNQMMRKALKGEPLTVYGSGNHLRDYVYVEDVASAFQLAGTQVELLNGRHYVIGSGVGHTVAETAKLVAERAERLTGTLVPITVVDWPAGAPAIERRSFVGNPEAFRQAAGWSPATDLVTGIDRTLAAFQSELSST